MRWLIAVILFIALLAAEAAIGARAGSALRDHTGAPAAGMLLVEFSAGAIFTLLACVLIGGAMAFVVRLRGHRITATLAAGAWLIGLASAMGGFREQQGAGGTVSTFLIECVMWAIVVSLIAAVLYQNRNNDRPAVDRPNQPREAASARIVMIVIGAAVAAAVVPVAIWLLARSEMRGQTIAAALIASLIVGLAGSFTIRERGGRIALFAVPLLAGGLACAFAWWQHQSITSIEIGLGWTPFALVMPHDYAAGSLFGVAAGLAWSRAFMSETSAP